MRKLKQENAEIGQVQEDLKLSSLLNNTLQVLLEGIEKKNQSINGKLISTRERHF